MDYYYDGESENDDLLLLLLLHRRRKSRLRRRFRVHPLWTRRLNQGVHDNLVKEMVIFNKGIFRNFLRMTVVEYEELLLIIGPKLYSAPTREDTITPSQKLLVTIRYLASGESITSLSYQFRIGKSTIDNIIFKTLEIIWETLFPLVLKMPETPEDWQKIITGFETKWQFPHCFGALDGKQVIMQAQPHSGSQFFNYKSAHNINLLALCDADYNFIAIEVGACGRQSDGGVLRQSNLGKKIVSRSLNLPPPTELFPGSPLISHFCVTDDAFPLDVNIMRPYPGRTTGRMPNDQRIYNYRLSRARRVIESTFGILVSQRRIFRVPINASLKNIKLITSGAVCLHNFLRQKQKNLLDDELPHYPANFTYGLDNTAETVRELGHGTTMDAFAPLQRVYIENLSVCFSKICIC